jgi:inner membrane protein
MNFILKKHLDEWFHIEKLLFTLPFFHKKPKRGTFPSHLIHSQCTSIKGGDLVDTGTHIVMGIALGGLATLDPVIANDPITAQSVLIGTIIGSQIPDIDTVLKLKNNAVYIRHHRGVTHSIPAVIIWPLVIMVGLIIFFPEANMFHLWIWTFLAVFLHVFVDIFNAYGTQALRPFSSKWVALGWINTFDPFIFTAFVGGLIIWGIGGDPGWTFLSIFLLIVGYYGIRYFYQRMLRHIIQQQIPDAKQIIIIPTMHFFQWRIAVMTPSKFFVGRAHKRSVTILDEFRRKAVPDSAVMEAAKKDKNISAFLSFSPMHRWEVKETDDYVEVRFIDLRYRSNGHYPFVAIVHLDDNLEIIRSYTGWVFSEDRLQRKLDTIENYS